LGVVRKDALLVRVMELSIGETIYIATYGHNYPSRDFSDHNFHVASAAEACDYILGKGIFSNLERPVSAACAIETAEGSSIGYKDVGE